MIRHPSRGDVARDIEALGAVAVVRLDEAAPLLPIVEALGMGGIHAVEVTMTMPGALDAIAMLASAKVERLLVGAGTVLDSETARMAIGVGAQFVVAPTLRLAVVKTCHRYDTVAIPGAYTPSEILTAWENGADLVKIFPASALGPGFIRQIMEPLPMVRLMATGGVNTENAGAFLQAGAAAVGIGGALIQRDVVSAGDMARITERAKQLTGTIRASRREAS